jgi:hypothetical protein
MIHSIANSVQVNVSSSFACDSIKAHKTVLSEMITLNRRTSVALVI